MPQKPFPISGFAGHMSALFALVPEPLFPAALGAFILGGITALRFLGVSLVGVFTRGAEEVGAEMGTAALGVLAAALAGGAGGLVIPIVTPLTRRLGMLGDYLTGILVVEAYIFSLVLVAPFAFGEPPFQEGSTAFLVIFSAVVGIFVTFFWRR